MLPSATPKKRSISSEDSKDTRDASHETRHAMQVVNAARVVNTQLVEEWSDLHVPYCAPDSSHTANKQTRPETNLHVSDCSNSDSASQRCVLGVDPIEMTRKQL